MFFSSKLRLYPMDKDLEKVEKAEELLHEVEENRKKGIIEPINDRVKLTKEYIDGLRNKVGEMHLSTREDMESFRETMSVLRDTVTAVKGSASKEDIENFRATMISISKTLVTVRDTVESVRKTAETIREIMIIASMFKKEFVNTRETKETKEHPTDSQSIHNEGSAHEVRESVKVDKD